MFLILFFSTIIILGGYAGSYKFSELGIDEDLNFKPQSLADAVNIRGEDKNAEDAQKTPDFVKGRGLNRAWMFNGYKWVRLPSMSVKRDRPACTLVQKRNGNVSTQCQLLSRVTFPFQLPQIVDF